MTNETALDLPRPWLPLVVATFVALGVLFASIGLLQYGLIALSDYYVRTLPEYSDLQPPLLALLLGGGMCFQVAIVATAILVGRVRTGRILQQSAMRWVDLMVAAITVAGLVTVTLVILLRIADALPPGIMLVLVVGGVALAVLDLLLLVLRSLLRRAILLRTELDEVV
ncbi:DUF2975 domain-containing protein [Pseudolysinimonas yzui]|uniref:DUF2975 domain-containing protein n=1 Tax=Pseudolysinimonas yzui TaxID=2708254 RepID=A0A8J3GPH6_9MICO|nr:DUF2975 domain-containing protein [Pseudolysinimonas yzui]GHF10397.1 hypothetical protein GCM10011600_09420 [Pseudolysinimonas yzui]